MIHYGIYDQQVHIQICKFNYYKQRSLLHVSANVLFEEYITQKVKII